MSKHRLEGNLKQTKGSIKEAIGKLTGDKKIEIEGAAEKHAGKVQSAVGNAANELKKRK